jgi:catechol 2,3-dioxygenase-like lactoylglutathione lyase family enzyme
VRLQHVSIVAPLDSAERVRWFYGELLGLEERDVPPKLDPANLIWFRVGGDLELHVMLEAVPAHDRRHFCLVVDGELDGWRTRLEQAAVETSDATPIVGRPRFFCRDPFGNLVELTRFD